MDRMHILLDHREGRRVVSFRGSVAVFRDDQDQGLFNQQVRAEG